MSQKESVHGTPEGCYFRSFQWEYDGFKFTCPAVTEAIKGKLKDIFEKWKIGYDCDRTNCKPGLVNVNVSLRQLRRVQILPDSIKYTNGATDANLRLS